MTDSTTTPEPLPRLAYRIDEAVTVTGLSKATLYRCIAAHELQVVKIRGRTLIEHAQLEAFLARGRVAA